MSDESSKCMAEAKRLVAGVWGGLETAEACHIPAVIVEATFNLVADLLASAEAHQKEAERYYGILQRCVSFLPAEDVHPGIGGVLRPEPDMHMVPDAIAGLHARCHAETSMYKKLLGEALQGKTTPADPAPVTPASLRVNSLRDAVTTVATQTLYTVNAVVSSLMVDIEQKVREELNAGAKETQPPEEAAAPQD